jgi:hypothetical protein
VSPLAPTIYTVTGVSGSCSGTKTISIGVGTNPTINAVTNNTLLCVGQTANLNVSVTPFVPGMTYTWSTSQTSANISVSPLVTTTYTVIGRNSQGCTSTASITQSVSACTGIDEVDHSNHVVTVFPNPSNGIFTISSTVDGKFEVVNQLGK